MGRNSGARPWLVVVLALLATGLGHLYLRRFARAVGWFVAALFASVFFVPPAAAEAVVSGGTPPLSALAPTLVVSGLSVVDAYLIATRDRTVGSFLRPSSAGRGTESTGPTGPPDATAPGTGTVEDEGDGAVSVTCPHCGRETDPEFDFCQWCASDIDAGGR